VTILGVAPTGLEISFAALPALTRWAHTNVALAGWGATDASGIRFLGQGLKPVILDDLSGTAEAGDFGRFVRHG
jgi:hypothetical protein